MADMSLCAWHQGEFASLHRARQQGRVAQALAIVGNRPNSAREFADAWLASLLCQAPAAETGCACGRCNACAQLAAGTHAERIVVQREADKKQIGIDLIRAFCGRMQLSGGAHGRYGLVVEADTMTREAANSLLKTLEEPAPNTFIVLTLSRLTALPHTIRSRCQLLVLPQPTREQIDQWHAEHPECDAQLLEYCGFDAAAALEAVGEGIAGTLAGWQEVLDGMRLRRINPVEAAKACDGDFGDGFLHWWQLWVRRGMRSGELGPRYAALWDALLVARRQLGRPFNSLLVLEGLFMLYADLLVQDRKEHGA